MDNYRAYFSAEYAQLKQTISDAIATINRLHGLEVPAAFERAVRVVGERRQFWSSFCDVPTVAIDTAEIARDWRAAREIIAAALTKKQAAPLDPTVLSSEAKAAIVSYELHRQSVARLSQELHQANEAIRVVKEQAATGNPAVLAADLVRLNAIKARQNPVTLLLCIDYLGEKLAKATTEQRREEARAALDLYRSTVFPAYQTAINLYLQKFNAGFRLASVTSANTRGGPACTYNVLINNTTVPISGGQATAGEPSFRNTLSAGDRNTLALAFFFASLDQDSALSNKIVVIDDPMTSLDEHRTLTTVQEIRRLSQRARQVIVLSHSKPFLCRMWENSETSTRCAVQVLRDNTGSNIAVWNVSADCITEYDRRHAELREYAANGAGTKVGSAGDPSSSGRVLTSCMFGALQTEHPSRPVSGNGSSTTRYATRNLELIPDSRTSGFNRVRESFPPRYESSVGNRSHKRWGITRLCSASTGIHQSLILAYDAGLRSSTVKIEHILAEHCKRE